MREPNDHDKILAYHIIETLRTNNVGYSTQQLADLLRTAGTTFDRALTWLVFIGAPITRKPCKFDRRRKRWFLLERDYRIPFDVLPAQAKIWELERVIAPGDASNLLESVTRLQRDNRLMSSMLGRRSTPCQSPASLPSNPSVSPQTSTTRPTY